MKYALTLVALFTISLTFGQNQAQYSELVKEAWNLYEAKDYQKSAAKYKAAFDQLDGKAYSSDRYNAACAYALAEDKENAFYHLFYLSDNPRIKYKDLDNISNDTDLNFLHSDDRWDKLIKTVTANKQEYEKDLDLPLVAMLDTIYQLDQAYRREIGAIEEKYGRDSEEMQVHWRKIIEADSLNLIKVKKVLDESGWLGAKVIGDQGNRTLFLVIQHADPETQVKYLPMMREAAKNGNASPSSLALLEDRVALGQGKRQIYGSQIGRDQETGEHYVLPLIDPAQVNERRAEVGLGPIEEYAFMWNIKWDLEKHKERTKRVEAGEKK